MTNDRDLGRLWDSYNESWLDMDDKLTIIKADAVLVPRADWESIYKRNGYDFVECGEDELMQALKMPMLPGLEIKGYNPQGNNRNRHTNN